MFLPPLIFGLVAALKFGPRQTFAAQVFEKAIGAARLSRKEAADQCVLTEPQLSAQLSGRDSAHLSLYRIVEMSPAVIASIGKQLFEEFCPGGVCIDKEEVVEIVTTGQHVAERLRAVEVELRESRQQTRMELPEDVDMRKRA